MFRFVIGALFVLILAFLVVMVVGYFTPEEYEGELTEFFLDRRPILWQALVSIENIPHTKPDVKSIEILNNDRGLITWKERLSNGGYRTYRTVEKREPFKYTINLFDSSGGLTGTWTFFLSQSNNGTVVTIKEESKNTKVWLRGIQAILGRDVNLRHHMKVLRAALFRRLINTP